MPLKPYFHKAQYYETDTMKIVHHSNYIRWMEEARVDALEQMDLGYDKMERAGILSPVLSVSCTYKSMTRFPETVEILVSLRNYTGVRLELSYEIRDAATKEIRALGESSHCFINEKGMPVSLRRRFPEWDKIFLSYFPERAEE